MLPMYMIGLLPHGEAIYTNSAEPLEVQKAEAMTWLRHYDNLISVHAVVGGSISDITAAYCRMWINKADLDDYEAERDFPSIVRDTVPELISEVLSDRAENRRASSQLRSDYHGSVL